MATLVRAGRARRFAPDAYERFLSVAALILLAFVFAAMSRSHGDVFRLRPNLIAHLATIVVALALTPVMLLRPRGDVWHRRLGWVWATAMMLTALISFTIRVSNNGQFSFIHILSFYTVAMVPLVVWFARTHRIAQHRRAVRGMVTGALLIAGFFTFPFNRLLGRWLFG